MQRKWLSVFCGSGVSTAKMAVGSPWKRRQHRRRRSFSLRRGCVVFLPNDRSAPSGALWPHRMKMNYDLKHVYFLFMFFFCWGFLSLVRFSFPRDFHIVFIRIFFFNSYVFSHYLFFLSSSYYASLTSSLFSWLKLSQSVRRIDFL